MAAALPFVGMAMSVFGSIMGEKESSDRWNQQQENKARNAKLNAEKTRMETEEELRRHTRLSAKKMGEAKAKAHASGFRPGSTSNVVYLSDIEEELAREADWIKKSGQSREDIFLDEERGAMESISSPNYLLAGLRGASSGLGWFA